MARKAKGKPLTLRPLRLDDDVWAEMQKMKATGTINEGLRAVLFKELFTSQAVEAASNSVHLDAVATPASSGQGKATVETYQRPKLTGGERLQIARGMRPVLRQKGDKTR